MREVFLIFLPGGGQCYDLDSCSARWSQIGLTHMSSLGFQTKIQKSGIFDSNKTKSALWGANKVLLGYCSSDGYMGDAAASPETWGWHFRGQRLVFTMIKELIRFHGLSSASTIVMGGASAGARGVMTLLELLIKQHFPEGSKVIGFLDSPYYIDFTPFSNKFPGFMYEEKQKYLYFNTTGALSSACIEQFKMDNGAWKCQFGEYRMPFLNVPYFMVASQYDSYQLTHNTQSVPPYISVQLDSYASAFGRRTKELIEELVASKSRLISSDQHHKFAYISWSCYDHAISESDLFSVIKTADGITQNEALHSYIQLDPFLNKAEHRINENLRVRFKTLDLSSQDFKSVVYAWIDQCSGISCSEGCTA